MMLPALSFVVSCGAAGSGAGAPITAVSVSPIAQTTPTPRATKPATKWTGIYAADPNDRGSGQLAILERGRGSYWVAYQGYFFSVHEEGEALVADPAEPSADCPFQRRECNPPPSRIQRKPDRAVEVSGVVLSLLPQNDIFEALQSTFDLEGESKAHSERGLVRWTSRRPNRSDQCRLETWLVMPGPKRFGPYRTASVDSASLNGHQGCPTEEEIARRVQTLDFAPGLAVVLDASSQVVGLTLVGYMYEDSLVRPGLTKAQSEEISHAGFRALGMLPGSTAE